MTVQLTHLTGPDFYSVCGPSTGHDRGTEDIDEVTCEHCLVVSIMEAADRSPVAVQGFILRLGELHLMRNHPGIYRELDRLGQVSRLNAEIREGLAGLGNDQVVPS